MLQANDWGKGVNEKTFLTKSPYNPLAGWEHDGEKQTDVGYCMFNMILKDGTRSDNPMSRVGIVVNRYDYFLPENKRITAVTIYYLHKICGFRFHLSDGSNWDIGRLEYFSQTVHIADNTENVNIADNEVIVGFKAKSHPHCPAYYVEWQFITAQGLRFN